MKWIVLVAFFTAGCIAEPEPSSSVVPFEDAGVDAAHDSGTMDASTPDLGMDAGAVDTGVDCIDAVANEGGECVECTDNTQCPEKAPICDNETCVCTADSECPDFAPNCGADGECFACNDVAADRQCGNAKPHCVDGRCQECRITSEEADCGGTRCAPDGICTGEEVDNQSFGDCRTCRDDAQCDLGLRCVKITSTDGGDEEFEEQVCLPVQDDGCPRPFTRTIMSRESEGLNHRAVYCAPVRRLSCQAVREYDTECFEDGEACSLTNQHCISVRGGDSIARLKCVYECDTELECPSEPEGTGCTAYPVSKTGDVCAAGSILPIP